MCGYLYISVLRLGIFQITVTGKQIVFNVDMLFTFYAA